MNFMNALALSKNGRAVRPYYDCARIMRDHTRAKYVVFDGTDNLHTIWADTLAFEKMLDIYDRARVLGGHDDWQPIENLPNWTKERFTPKLFTRAVIRKSNCVLVLHNIARNRWELPGGKLELGETYSDALIREVQEETNVAILEAQVIAESVPLDTDSGSWKGTFFYADKWAGTAKVMETRKHSEVRFVTLQELEGLPQIPRVTLCMAARVLLEDGYGRARRQEMFKRGVK